MKKSYKKYIDLIEKFENGELSEKEKTSLLNELNSNPELKSEFELSSKISQAIKNNKLDEFKKILIKAQKKYESNN